MIVTLEQLQKVNQVLVGFVFVPSRKQNSEPVLRKFKKAALALRIGSVAVYVDKVMKKYAADRDDLVKKYGEEKDGKWTVKPESEAEFMQEFELLSATKVELPYTIPTSALDAEGISLTGLEAEILKQLLEED